MYAPGASEAAKLSALCNSQAHFISTGYGAFLFLHVNIHIPEKV